MTGGAQASETPRPSLVPGGIGQHPSCLLVRLGQVAYRLQEQAIDPLGVRVRHFSVLQMLVDLGATGQVDLGRQLRIDPATMAAALDHLESLDAVVRERDPADRRRYVVALTAEGRRLHERIVTAFARVDRMIDDELGDRATDLLDSLRTIAGSQPLIEAFDGETA
ncbi:MarR family winged helix-turn-helix transcriptional regulator [Nocardioides jejuensis]|uniref:MarR family transcriptional regulator n=1 Tax=Nocardioides jejuensis TaxID=2502782 RepID=A0A4R1C0E6_9ACTN|nr:MarR family winged helix-turn-helix transcriptional regulator [Nocardioides jejuensis]TCJ23914.1 MarR family transcriptional regulator [Nocardioides jejuensis]